MFQNSPAGYSGRDDSNTKWLPLLCRRRVEDSGILEPLISARTHLPSNDPPRFQNALPTSTEAAGTTASLLIAFSTVDIATICLPACLPAPLVA